MSLLLHIIVIYIKENIITKLQKLYSPPRNPRTGSTSPALLVKKLLCTGDLLPARKIFIERPETDISSKEGRRGLISIEDCVELAMRGLEVYVHGSEERLIQAARGDKIDGLEAASVLKRSKKEKRLEDWEKVLHGQYLRQTKEVRSDQCWAWLQNGDLKKETESLTVAAQNQSIRINLVKAKIGKR